MSFFSFLVLCFLCRNVRVFSPRILVLFESYVVPVFKFCYLTFLVLLMFCQVVWFSVCVCVEFVTLVFKVCLLAFVCVFVVLFFYCLIVCS